MITTPAMLPEEAGIGRGLQQCLNPAMKSTPHSDGFG